MPIVVMGIFAKDHKGKEVGPRMELASIFLSWLKIPKVQRNLNLLQQPRPVFWKWEAVRKE